MASVAITGLAAMLSWLAPEPEPETDVASRLTIEWEAPGSCPSLEAIRTRIDSYLGRDEFADSVDAVLVRGSARRIGSGWSLSLDIDIPGERIVRSVEASRCEDLRDAAALIIAVSLDPLRVSQTVPPPEPDPEPEPEPEPEPGLAPEPERAPTRRVALDVRVGGGLEVNATPRLGGTVALAVALVLSRVRVELAGRYAPPRTLRPFGEPAAAGVTVQTGVIAGRTCFVPGVDVARGRLELPSCAQFDVGVSRGRGVGLARSQVSHRPWIGVSIGQELVWHGRRGVGIWLGVDGMVTLLAPRFAVDDLGTVFAPGWATFRALAGPFVRF